MKRAFLSLLFFIIMICNGFSQSTLQEGFEGNTLPPEGWTAYSESENDDWEGWTISDMWAQTGYQSITVDYAWYGHDSYLITPQLNVTGHQVLSFWYMAESPDWIGDYTIFTVEVSTTGNLPEDFVVLQTCPSYSSPYSFVEMVVDLEEFMGQNIYLAFHVQDMLGTAIYIDDVEVSDFSGCVAPSEISLSSSDLHTANLSWLSSGEGVSYELQYKLWDASWTSAGSLSTNNTYASLGGLQPATHYQARIKALCDGGEVSEWSQTYDFSTACEVYTVTSDQLWFEDFESVSGSGASLSQLNACWSSLITPENYATPAVLCGVPFENHSGNNTLILSGDNPTEVNLLLLPAFANDLNTLRLSFYGMTTENSAAGAGRFEVGYVTDPNDPDTYVTLENVLAKDSSLSLAGFSYYGPFDFYGEVPANAARMAIKMTPTNWNTSWYLDDISVSLIPSCAAPSRLSISSVSSNSVQLYWAGREGVTYDILYWMVGSTDTAIVPNLSYSIDGYQLGDLMPLTRYEWMVRVNCGGGTSILSQVQTFTTIGNSQTLPYTRTFEEGDEVDEISFSGTGLNQWYVGTATGNPSDGSNPSHSMYISNDNGQSNEYVNNTSSAYAVLIVNFPNIDYEYHLNFDYKVMGEVGSSVCYDMFNVYMVDAGVDITPSFSSYYNLPESFPGTRLLNDQTYVTEWTNVDLILNNVAGTHKQIVFYWFNDGSVTNNPPVAVDNISIDYFSCPAPSALYASNIGSNEVELQWAENGNATSWKLRYKPHYSNVPYQEVIVDTNSYVLSGLASNTKYDCYVISVCGEDDYSGPSSHIIFRTDCGEDGITVLPMVEDFSAYDIIPNSNYAMYVPCWTRLTNTSSYQVYVNAVDYIDDPLLDFGYTPDNTYTMAVLPVFGENNPLNNLMIEMDVKRTNLQTGTLEVGALSNPDDESTFQAIDTVQLTFANVWEHYTIYTNNYEGSDRYLAFRAKGAGINNQVLIDNLRIDYLPDCVPASGIVASGITSNSATLTWMGSGTQYVVYVMRGNDTITQTVTGNSLMLDNLFPSSTYTVYVKTVCGAEEAPMSNPYFFFTECGAITISENYIWTECFDNYQGVSEYAIPLSPCWATPLTMSASNGVFPAVYRYGEAAHSGNTVLEIKGALTMFVLPKFANNLNELRFSMWANTNSNHIAGLGLMEVGVVIGTDASTFVPVDTVQITAFALTGNDSEHSDFMGPYNFSNIIPEEGQRIAVRYRCVDEESCYLDDFEVSLVPECVSPVKNSVAVYNISDHRAYVSWQDRDTTHHSWTIYYKISTAEDTAWQSILVENANTAILDDLESNTSYDVYVVTNCGEQPSEDATVVRHFTTVMESTPLPYTADFSDPTEWLLLNGTSHNRWVTGALTAYGTGDGLFISEDGTNPGYNMYSPSLSVAEKVFTVGTYETVSISFDVVAGGEGIYDYLKVFFTSSTNRYEEVGSSYMYNSLLPNWATVSYSIDAVDFSDFLPNYSTPYILSNTSGSNPLHVTVVMPNPNASPVESSTAKLVFAWYNDNTSTDGQPAAVITNLTVSPVLCPSPTNVEANQVYANSAHISWSASVDANEWMLAYKSDYDQEWTEVTGLTTNSYTILGLEPATRYTVRVASVCSGIYSDPGYGYFVTPQCDTVDQCTYMLLMEDSGGDGWGGAYVEVKQYGVAIATATVPYGLSNSERYLLLCNNVATSLIWHSGPYDNECSFSLVGPDGSVIFSQNDFYYGMPAFNFTTQCPNVAPCQAPVSLQANDVTRHAATISWADDESAESWLIEYKKSTAQDWVTVGPVDNNSIALTGLSLKTTYLVHVKSICNSIGDDVSAWSQVISFTTADSVVLPVVETQPANHITYNSARLRGLITELGNQDIVQCGFEWKEANAGEYSLATTMGATMTSNLTNLNPTTDYVFRAFASTPDTTVYGEELSFTTLEEPIPCAVPTDLMQMDATHYTLSVSWVDHAEANRWQLHYRANNDYWTTVEVHTSPNYTITGLTPGVSYEVQVRAVCESNSYSDWSMSSIFTTIGLNEYLQSQVVLYPNPAKKVVNVQCTMNNVQWDGATIEVLDVYGKLLQTLKVDSEITQINVSGLADGMYFVRVTTDQGVVTKSFVKK